MLYGGNVLGKFEELVPEKKIQQSWRLKNWSSGHYSNVVIELEETVSKMHAIAIEIRFGGTQSVVFFVGLFLVSS